MATIRKADLNNVSGGGKPLANVSGKNQDRCPYYDSVNHLFYPTGESRPTDAWFYDTEEHYVCACGAGYWYAGFWSEKKWDHPEIQGPQIGNPLVVQ